ncbi:hypothetical protein BS17DRAFT_790049 [Gyrodon lividus]|nr:hypothetical protein BS17DRAFT_790049 [Gyrodon lividus]
MAGHGQGQGQGAAPADIGFIVQQAVQNAIQPLNARLDRIDQRLARIDQRLAGIDQRLPEIDQRLAGIDQRLGRIDRRVGELLDISYQSHNILSLDGITRPYKVIPFRQDGQEIWPEEHNLPRLTTAAAVHALHVPQVDAYLDGYHIPRAGRPRRSTKIKRLKAHIGCAYPA